MNTIQNKEKKYKDKRIKELELENVLLRQKLEMIINIAGLDKTYKDIPFVGEKMAAARPIATVWKHDKDNKVLFQTNNEDDKKFLENAIDEKISQVSELAGKDIEKGLEKKNEEEKVSDVIKHFSK